MPGEEGVCHGFMGLDAVGVPQELLDDFIAAITDGIGGFQGVLGDLGVVVGKGAAGKIEQAFHFHPDLFQGIIVFLDVKILGVELTDLKDILAVVTDAFGILGHAHQGEGGRDFIARIDGQVTHDFSSDRPQQIVDGLVAGENRLPDICRCDFSSQHLVGANEHPLGVIEHFG